MPTIALISLFMIAVLGLFVWRATKGPARSLDELEQPITDLLNRGYDGGFLLIFVGFSRVCIQLRKYIRSPGHYGIELAFPNAKWSKSYFVALRSYLTENGIEYGLVDYGGPLDFIRVDFGLDSDMAFKVVKDLILDVLNVPSSQKFFVRLENASIIDETIDA